MPDNKLKAKGFLVWGICALFFLYEFFLRTVIGTYQNPIMQNLELTSLQFSLLSTTIFFLIYGLMQIPAGLIVDHIGLKKSLLIGAFCCTISAIGFSYSNSYQAAISYRLLMGFGASFGFICLLISVRDWMPHKYSALFIGLSQFIGTLGPMAATGPLNSLSESMGITWRSIFLYLGAMGIVITALIFFFVENNKQKTNKFTILHKPEKIFTSLLRLFSRMQPWYIAIFSASLYFTLEYLSENEGRAFLGLKEISIYSASYMLTIAWIGYAIGCPLLGFLSDILQRRTGVMKLSAAIGLVAILMILYLSKKLHLQIAFFFLGLSASGQSIGFAIIAEQFKKKFIAVGFGLNNAVITTISAINAPLIGILLDNSQGGESTSLSNYLYVFNILIATALIALICAVFFIKETYCKSAVDFTTLTPKGGKSKR